MIDVENKARRNAHNPHGAWHAAAYRLRTVDDGPLARGGPFPACNDDL